MRGWAYILRFVGGAWFVWVFIANLRTLFEPYTILEIEIDFRLTAVENIIRAAVTAAMCFGVASGLEAMARMEERVLHRNTVPRPVMLPGDVEHNTAPQHWQRPPESPPPVKRDVAPKAPWDWGDLNPRPTEPEKDDSYEQRMARRGRYRVTRKTNVRRNIGTIAKDLIQDAKDKPQAPSEKRFDSKVRK